jgi:hypothetical protein
MRCFSLLLTQLIFKGTVNTELRFQYINLTGKEPNMASTRGTDHVVDFILSKERIDAATIRTEQWVPILRAAVDELPLNYLRGFQSMKQVLAGELPFGNDPYTVERSLPTPLPSLMLGDRHMRPNEVFLNCAETQNRFPCEVRLEDKCGKAPREKNDDKFGARRLLPITSGNILLSRDKKFYHLFTRWHPKEEWGQSGTHEYLLKFWYEADPDSIFLLELDDRRLENTLAADGYRAVPQAMLQCFHLALRRTADDVAGQHRLVLGREKVVAGYLDRMGLLFE